jgi:sugar O-acyltransferase (sialic acid O-acetyltransferase NeuD family)
MTRPIVLWGATGQAKVLAEFLPRLGFSVVATFDSNPMIASPFPGVPIFYGAAGFEQWRRTALDECSFLVAIGGTYGADRVALFNFLKGAGLQTTVAKHPTAQVASDASIGEGCQLLVGSIVAAQAKLGTACIVNTKASIDHECTIGNGVHIAPGATLCGAVVIEDEAFIGANAVVLPRLTVGRGAVVGAGAIVTKDVLSGALVRGNPARLVQIA